jgi:hypothetical protein
MGWFILKHIFSTILSIISITRLSNQEKDLEIPYGLKTSTEKTKNKYLGFPTIYEQKSKLTTLEIWRVILKRSISFR